ncbi:MAG: DUF3833 family protein, partial [Phycisphaerales bacterium]|nr:DUF3833 family protein [Phycisphaerales bacterium]
MTTVFGGKQLLVGVTGGIAAYKTATLVSRLVQSGAGVTVLMTPGACRFVTPLTFQALSGRPVYTSVWEHIESQDPQHIALAHSADAALVAPCSMDCLARLAAGRADDVVGTATGIAYGKALNWQYDFDLKVGDRTIRVRFDDWMFRQDEKVMVNRATVSKFGIEL